jgi:hypothetical protein
LPSQTAVAKNTAQTIRIKAKLNNKVKNEIEDPTKEGSFLKPKPSR